MPRRTTENSKFFNILNLQRMNPDGNDEWALNFHFQTRGDYDPETKVTTQRYTT